MAFFLNETPIPAITNAGPVLLQKQISLSNSSFEITDFLYKSDAYFTPSGNPQIVPVKNAPIDTGLILNSLPNRFLTFCGIISKTFPYNIISEKIINGNSDGITERIHNNSPQFIKRIISCKFKKENTIKVNENNSIP